MATIQGIYIALFGRPADPLGLQYFEAETNGGADLTAIGDLAATAEYQSRFEGMSNVEIVNSIYQSLYGRDADLAGLTFFVTALQDGTYNINNIAIAILDGAQGNDAAILANKLEAANLFTESLDTGSEVVAYQGDDAAAAGRAFLSGVTSDDATVPTQAEVDAAIEAIVDADTGVGPGVPGSVYTLTDSTVTGAADNITGTANDDNFRALQIGGNNTIETVDTINGGAGFDTLNAELVNGTTVAPVLSSVERVNASVDAAGTATFNGSAASGLQQVWNTNVVGGNGNSTLLVTGITTAVALGIRDTDANDNDVLNLTATFSGVGGTNDTANVVLDGSDTGSTVTANGIENFNVNVVSGSIATLNTTAANVGESITVTGSGNLNLTVGANLDDQLETVNGAAHTGALTLNATVNQDATITSGSGADTINLGFGAGTEVATINTGAGNDTVNIAATESHSVTLGAGVDTLNVDATAGVNLAAGDILTGAALQEAALKVSDFVSADDTLNVNTTGATELNLTGTQLSDVADEANLLDAITVATSAGYGFLAGDLVAFQFDGNSYVYVDEDASGGLTAGDALIELTGVTSLNGADVTAF